ERIEKDDCVRFLESRFQNSDPMFVERVKKSEFGLLSEVINEGPCIKVIVNTNESDVLADGRKDLI
ncbi:MAG: hypothetical protein ABIC57_03775, partial [bacterium]